MQPKRDLFLLYYVFNCLVLIFLASSIMDEKIIIFLFIR